MVDTMKSRIRHLPPGAWAASISTGNPSRVLSLRQLPTEAHSRPIVFRSNPHVSRRGSSSLSQGLPSSSFMSDKQAADQAAASNSLGLDLEALKIKDNPDSADPKASADAKDTAPSGEDASKSPDGSSEKAQGDADQSQTDAAGGQKEPKEKKKPYVNPDRVKTGGAQRVRVVHRVLPWRRLRSVQDKLSEEELAERMARIREQNEKIKQRRLVRILPANSAVALWLICGCRMCKPMRRSTRRRKQLSVPSWPR